MTSIVLPSTPGPAVATISRVGEVIDQRGLFGGTQLRFQRLGLRHRVEVETPPMRHGDDARAWIAALLKADATASPVRMAVPRVDWDLQGAVYGRVSGADQAGRILTSDTAGSADGNRLQVPQSLHYAPPWTPFNVTVTDGVTSPLGGVLQSIAAASAGGSSMISQLAAVTRGVWTFSFIVGPNTTNHCLLQLYDGADAFARAWFNLATGVVSNTGAVGFRIVSTANTAFSGAYRRLSLTVEIDRVRTVSAILAPAASAGTFAVAGGEAVNATAAVLAKGPLRAYAGYASTIAAGTPLSIIVGDRSYLYFLTDDVDVSTGAGSLALDALLLRGSPADNAVIEFDSPIIEGFLEGNVRAWTLDLAMQRGLTFAIEEAK